MRSNAMIALAAVTVLGLGATAAFAQGGGAGGRAYVSGSYVGHASRFRGGNHMRSGGIYDHGCTERSVDVRGGGDSYCCYTMESGNC